MRIGVVLQVAALLTLAACDSNSPSCDLAGSWAWELNQNPAGSDLHLTLSTVGDSVTGLGLAHGIGPTRTPDSISIAGHVASHSPAFDLTLDYYSGRAVTYGGTRVCPGTLDVTSTEGASTFAIVFVRE